MPKTVVSSIVSNGSKGAISELVVTVDLMRRGFEVFRNVSPNGSCDLIALKGEHTVRIEVKGRALRKHRSSLSTSWRSKRYDANKFQVLAAVCGSSIQYKRSIFHALNPASEELVLNKINDLAPYVIGEGPRA